MDYLMHHGVKGQKWGVRRYQNKNGTYTNSGKTHRKELAKSFKNAALSGAVGGAVSGAVSFALTATNPALISTAAATYVGKSIVAMTLSSVAQTAVRSIADSDTTKYGRRAVNG
jgi:hypothetical protein